MTRWTFDHRSCYLMRSNGLIGLTGAATPLHSYLTTAIGDTYPHGAHGGQLSKVLYQPKYEEDVFKVLLMNDFLGNYIWFGGISCEVRANARIMKELGAPL